MSNCIKAMPLEKGFVMPSEWGLHEATWTCWPFDDDMWFGYLNKVRDEFAELVKTIAKFEPVHLLVRDKEAKESAIKKINNLNNISIHEIPLDDIWFRDNGPIFVKNQNNVSFVKWEFNSWGQKYNWELDNLAPFYVSQFLNMIYPIQFYRVIHLLQLLFFFLKILLVILNNNYCELFSEALYNVLYVHLITLLILD
jgi:agmatine/peptidylarginine deiminase